MSDNLVHPREEAVMREVMRIIDLVLAEDRLHHQRGIDIDQKKEQLDHIQGQMFDSFDTIREEVRKACETPGGGIR